MDQEEGKLYKQSLKALGIDEGVGRHFRDRVSSNIAWAVKKSSSTI
jgi:hypothetical protein